MNATHAIGTGGIVFALVLSGQGFAAGYGEGRDASSHTFEKGHPSFTELDVSGDGVLSKAEAAGRRGPLSNWGKVDTNRDNVIDRSEFAAFEAVAPLMPPPPSGEGMTEGGSGGASY